MQMEFCDIMIFRRVIIFLSAVVLCLMIGVTCGQDWLGGGYVGSYSGDLGKYFTDPIFYSNGMRGCQVFLDGSYIGTEGTAGGPLDGKLRLLSCGWSEP
jgi:hypothetical protein